MSKVVIVFEFGGIGQKEYDTICDELMAQGKLYNEKRPAHLSFDKDGKWCVIDVWDSEEALNAFVNDTLGPIFGKLGLNPQKPAMYKVHSYVGLKAEEPISA